nr:hypothetical protein KitaXyl93_78880 [Kitasatospora sp. Xyl93]
MAHLGTAYNAVQESVGATARDEVYLDSPGWSGVVAAAARLAQVLVSNDHSALSKLHDAGHRWPLDTRASYVGDGRPARRFMAAARWPRPPLVTVARKT